MHAPAEMRPRSPKDDRDTTPRHPESHSRFRAPAKVASTIPPAPMARHADLEAVEWWLDAHMALASNLLCLEQTAEEPSHVPVLGDLRDALYELYCDASEPRMRPALEMDQPLPAYIKAVYELADSILTGHPRADASRSFALFDAATGGLGERAASVLQAIPMEADNPVEPLRFAIHHLEDVLRLVDRLRAAALGIAG